MTETTRTDLMEKADKPQDVIIRAFDEVITREIAEADAVRAEIKQKGTYWAGHEIWKLRRQVASLRKQLQEANKCA